MVRLAPSHARRLQFRPARRVIKCTTAAAEPRRLRHGMAMNSPGPSSQVAVRPRPMVLVRESGAPSQSATTSSGTVRRLPLQQKWQRQLREERAGASQRKQQVQVADPRIPAALPHRPVFNAAVAVHSGSASSPSGYKTPESDFYENPRIRADSSIPASAHSSSGSGKRRHGLCGCGSRPESHSEVPVHVPTKPAPVPIEDPSPVSEPPDRETGPSVALKNWYWHQGHAEKRAERVELNEGGGLKFSKDTPGQPGAADLPTEEIADPYIDNYIATQQLHNNLRGVVLICTRSTNHNVVVYRARREGDTGGSINSSSKSRNTNQLSAGAATSVFDTDDPLDYFWYDNAPDFVEKRRRKGVLSDRIEMTGFEKKGFGLSIDENRASTEGVVVAKMVAMPTSVFASAPDVDGPFGLLTPGEFRLENCEDGVDRLVTVINNQQCFAEKIYISTQAQRFNPIPKVMFIRIFGINVETGDRVTQDLKA